MELRVAAVQLSSGSDPSRNVDEAERSRQEAADQGARYVQLPEYFNFLGPFSGFADVAEPIPGPTTTRMAKLAKSRELTLHLGSLLESSPVEGKFFNTSVVIGPDGEIVATYRKIHLFDVNVPGAIVHRESDVIAPGERDGRGAPRGASSWVSRSVSTCAFPSSIEGWPSPAPTSIAIPAAFNAVTGRAHWDLLVRARAVENHVFVVAAAQVGTTAEGIATYGHSLIVDPWGVVLAESISDEARGGGRELGLE